MTIDEVIAKAEKEAERQEFLSTQNHGYCEEKWNVKAREKCAKCATEHRRLAEWLQELRAYRKLRICGNCRHYVSGTTHFGECHVTSDIEPWVVSVIQTACDTFFDYKDLEMEREQNDT